MSEESLDFTNLYALMPRQKVRTIWNIPVIWFKDLGDRKVAVDALSLLVKSLPGIIGIISIVLIGLSIYSYNSFMSIYTNYPYIFYVICAILFSILITYSINYYLNVRLMQKLRNLDHHRDFEFRQYVFLGKIDESGRADYAYRYIVTAETDFVKSFPAIFSWSGQGKLTLHPRNKAYTITRPSKVAGNATRIDIVFDEPMRKNEERVIEYVISTLADAEHPPLPHLALSIRNKKYPSFNTYIISVFSDRAKPISIYRDYFFGGYAAGRLKNVAVDLDDNLAHAWDLRFRVNWAYCIRWET